MPSAKRPNNSCWTCRLRRKKCDERLPSCATCERLEIACYRSDRKPEFMDGGEKEKQMSIKISHLVKSKNDSLRRTRALEAKRRRQCQSQDIAKSSQHDIPASKIMISGTERLQTSLIASSSFSAASNPQSVPWSLKNQDGLELAPGTVCCEYWVKVLTDDTLSIHKDRLSNQPGEANGLHNKADEVQKLLGKGVQYLVEKYAELTAFTPDRIIKSAEAEVNLQQWDIWINSIFVRAALIYLHITLHGTDARALPAAKRLVFEWIFNFRFLPDYTLLPNLVWPLCIAGCMATTEKQQQFFRDTITSSGIDRQSPCMIWRALEIMTKCWEVSVIDGMQPGDLKWTKAVALLWDKVFPKPGSRIL